MAVTYAQMCDAIEGYLAAGMTAAVLLRSQSYDELSEGMQDSPTLQVYPEGCEPVSFGSETQTFTFKAGVIQEVHIIHADYYAKQRSHLGEDMAALVDGIDEIVELLEETSGDTAGCPPFGLDGLKTFTWSWRRVVFDYGGVLYMGARFTINLRTF